MRVPVVCQRCLGRFGSALPKVALALYCISGLARASDDPKAFWREVPQTNSPSVERPPTPTSQFNVVVPSLNPAPSLGAPVAPKNAFAVDGIILGGQFGQLSLSAKQYNCESSDQFEGFLRCHRSVAESERRGRYNAHYSILHDRNGTVVYVNRFQSPAYWDPGEVSNDLSTYSRKIGAPPTSIFEAPRRAGILQGTIASWGDVRLEPLDANSLRALAGGRPLRLGILVDFLGDFSRSAKTELPVFRVTGGTGFVWAASYDETGRGTLRFFAVDPKAYTDQTSKPVASGQPPQVSSGPATTSPTGIDKPVLSEQSSLEPAGNISGNAAFANVTADELKKNSKFRESLFKNLQTRTKQYTFDYVVIELPPGTVPGISVAIPVSYVRYNSTVFFAFDKFALEAAAESAINDFAKTILADKSYRSILVVGHTDSLGTDEYNYALSKNRAVTVASALRTLGVQDRYLGVVPMGEAQPYTTNSTEQGRGLNRRVEFFISDVPEATKKAIERIEFNPCFRNDHEPTRECRPSETHIPILTSAGESRPGAEINLTRAALPSNVQTNGVSGLTREPLPQEILERPSLRDLQHTE